jgi:predicted Ser/Thr protein kinase
MNKGKMIGMGNTASVYEWEDGKVLKLYHQGYSYEAITNEYHNARAINNMDFAKPRVYDMISYEGKTGIIYEKIKGESLLDWTLETGWC